MLLSAEPFYPRVCHSAFVPTKTKLNLALMSEQAGEQSLLIALAYLDEGQRRVFTGLGPGIDNKTIDGDQQTQSVHR